MNKTIPKAARNIPVIGHAIPSMQDPIRFLERCYQKYGSIFSIQLPGLNTIFLIGPEHNKWVFDETDKRLSIQEGYTFFKRMFDSGFFYFGGFEAYKAQKNIVLPCFRATQMPDYLDVMSEETLRFMQSLGTSGTFDLTSQFGPLVMKIAAHSFLGADFKERIGEDIFEDFRQFSEGMDPVIPGWVPLPKFRRSQKAKKRLHNVLLNLIEERRSNPLDTPDFLQTLIQSTYQDGQPVPNRILIDLILLLVWAGHETTAGHISWAMIDLLQHPEYLKELMAEQQNEWPEDASLTMNHIKNMNHSEWALKETERLHPVAYILLRNARVDISYQGYHIPKGSAVFISPALTHKLPEYFSEPEIYNPLRFADGKVASHSLIGFGGGIHRCTGVHFAFLEMKVILNQLLRYYDLELITKNPEAVKGPVTKWPQSPCLVRYKRKRELPSTTYAIPLKNSKSCPHQ